MARRSMNWMAQRRALAKEWRRVRVVTTCTKGDRWWGGEGEATESREEIEEATTEEEGCESGSEVGGEVLEGVTGWGGKGRDEAEASASTDEVESKSLQALTLTLSPSPSSPPSSNLHHHYQLLSCKILAGNLKSEEAGMALINLLLKCTIQVSTGNLAGTDIFLRLISTLASPTDGSLQRLSSHLASALTALLRHHLPGLLSALRPPALSSSPLTSPSPVPSRTSPSYTPSPPAPSSDPSLMPAAVPSTLSTSAPPPHLPASGRLFSASLPFSASSATPRPGSHSRVVRREREREGEGC